MGVANLVTEMPPSGIATTYTPRRFHIFMRRTTPVEPSEPVEPAKPLSQTIKGRCAPWAHPESHFPTSTLWLLFYPKGNSL